ncbi:subtilisin-like protease SBT1.7 [Phalaenopsis equestris]|uniref:subtilisin-like protease SBT1.7 n=1 Tax=Phalaenopsis equestris TaxID=78828 RepID=UPI0009E611E0|nr:subtilisin-like protease SBT1.7 [Phalaenopsis equestris]
MARPVIFFLLLLLLSIAWAAAERASYIVHMAKTQMPPRFTEHSHWYDASLRSISDSADLLYTYDTVAHGFSALLTPAEARILARHPGVLSVLPDTPYYLHTTRTPEFLGLDLPAELVPESSTIADVVIGVLDTGVWPERNSFDDNGLGPVPAFWKGECVAAKDFDPTKACNRKLIGARFFSKGYESSMGPIDESHESRSPRDADGHGTHTSTTAAGSAVTNASLLGYAEGTARGMALRARISVYKVCWAGGCFSSDILAAMDAAVNDGCHVLSLSLGGGAADYYRDSVAIGAFNAMEKGVLVSCSAGNAGPGTATLSNLAPWITTVGAGTLDRDFPAYVVLGNGKNYTGVSLYSGKLLPSTPIALVYAGNATNSSNGNLCMPGTLLPEKVAGKVVLCERGINARVQKGMVVKDAGGAGMILANTATNSEELVADAHLLPATLIGEKAGNAVKAYSISDPNPTATIIFGGTKVGVSPSPVVAAFSSRGPNSVTPEILKPDLIAPGVNILAGWTGAVGPTGLPTDSRRVEFNIISGTSMSCPHVSGLAALLKEEHPDWSPAAIKSALMTTAYVKYQNGDGILDVATGQEATPFDLGAGHVDPRKAMDPGLVYDLTAQDYLEFLCALNYTSLQIAAMSKDRNFSCDSRKNYAVSKLNYPSFSVAFATAIASADESASATVTHERTVTNVGSSATYKATATAKVDGGEVKIAVEPAVLSFTETGEKKSYIVKFTAPSLPSGSSGLGRLEWSDGKHTVASAIAFTWT